MTAHDYTVFVNLLLKLFIEIKRFRGDEKKNGLPIPFLLPRKHSDHYGFH